MGTRTPYTYWVCVDCYEEHHGVLREYDTDRPAPLSLIPADAEVTAGLVWGEHDEECAGRKAHEAGDCHREDDEECECERQTFSWSLCDGCSSALGGAREALTVWEEL